MRARAAGTFWLAIGCAIWPVLAGADVDMNGPWGVQTTYAFGIGSFVQNGTTLSATLQPGDQAWDGTIDPVSGAFTLTAPPVSPSCGPSVIAATVDGAGTSFTGTLAVEIFSALLMGCDRLESQIVGRRCGNGVLDPGEQCDDGNFSDQDCCSSTCQFQPTDSPCTGPNVCVDWVCDGAGRCVAAGPLDGRPCDDGLFCNGTDTCGGGTCLHSGDPCAGEDACHACDEATDRCLTPSGAPCGPCRACDGTGECVGTPRPSFDCKRPGSAASQLTIVDATLDTKDELRWKWGKGDGVTAAELGNPAGADGYAVCLFDESLAAFPYRLLFSARAPAGGAWKSTASAIRYRSPGRDPDGLSSMTVAAGVPGRAKLSVRGAGDLLPLPQPAMPLPLPLAVQLQGDAGLCVEATFTSATSNDGTRFRARSE